MNAIVLLADYAQVADGKLYITGGGWSWMRGGGPFSMSIALRILVPWDRSNEQHDLKLSLYTQDASPVLAGSDPVEIRGAFEVGRPAGVPKGSELDALLAVQVNGLALDPGSYYWQVSVNDEPIERASFRVIP